MALNVQVKDMRVKITFGTSRFAINLHILQISPL